MFLCVSGTSKKNLVNGALIEAEILTSHLPIYLLNLAQFLGTGSVPSGVSASTKQSRILAMCLRNFQKNLVHGALIEAEILISHSPMYFLNLAQFRVLALYLQVCQDLPSDLEMFLYVSGTSNKIWCMGS